MITRRHALVLAAGAAGLAICAPQRAAARSPAPKDAYLYLIWPNDGDVIKGGFWARFGLRNMGVAPAGIAKEHVGHHHLLIDADIAKLDMNEPIPADRNHLHFGAGQTEARLELPPGKHTLQLVLGDHDHVPFDPPVVSRRVTITVV